MSGFLTNGHINWDAHREGWVAAIGCAILVSIITFVHVILIWRKKDSKGNFLKSTRYGHLSCPT